MTPEFQRELFEFLEANRQQALWWTAPDAVPQTTDAARRLLRHVAARGDRATFIRAHQLLRRLA